MGVIFLIELRIILKKRIKKIKRTIPCWARFARRFVKPFQRDLGQF